MSHPIHPATTLLISLSLTLTTAIPLFSWRMLVNRKDPKVRWWFAGLLCASIGVLAVAVIRASSGVTASAMVLCLLCLVESMRLELGRPPGRYRLAALAYVAYAGAEAAIDLAGARHSWGMVLNSVTLVMLGSILLQLMAKVVRHHRSSALMLAAAVIPALLAVHGLRLVAVLLNGEVQPMFSHSALPNATIIVVILAVVLLTIGYAGFDQEKNHRQHLKTREAMVRVQVERQQADLHAAQLQSVVQQRDEMIMVSSKFSTITGLGIYSSSIVHEISQPLQSLRSALELLALDREGGADDPRIRDAIGLVDNVGEILHALRRLMSNQAQALDQMDLCEVVEGVLGVAQTECRKRGVHLHWTPPPDGVARLARVQRVLLERVLFNLITNSLEALDAHVGAQAQPRIDIRLLAHRPGPREFLEIQVADNGPGFPPQWGDGHGRDFHSSKPGGMGLGLPLARIIMGSWQGQLRVSRPQGGAGACVSLLFPVAAA